MLLDNVAMFFLRSSMKNSGSPRTYRATSPSVGGKSPNRSEYAMALSWTHFGIVPMGVEDPMLSLVVRILPHRLLVLCKLRRTSPISSLNLQKLAKELLPSSQIL